MTPNVEMVCRLVEKVTVAVAVAVAVAVECKLLLERCLNWLENFAIVEADSSFRMARCCFCIRVDFLLNYYEYRVVDGDVDVMVMVVASIDYCDCYAY